MRYVVHTTGDRGIRRVISRCSTLGQAELVADFLLSVKPDAVVEVFRGSKVVMVVTDINQKSPLSVGCT